MAWPCALLLLFAACSTSTAAAQPIGVIRLPSTESTYGITAAPDGSVWLAAGVTGPGGASENSIEHVSPQGSVTNYAVDSANGSWQPEAIATAPDGSVWFPHCLGHIDRVSAGGALTSFPIDGCSEAASLGPDGQVWYASSSFSQPGSRFSEIGSDGHVTPIGSTNGEVETMERGPDGAVWFGQQPGDGDYGPTKIGRIDPGGAIQSFQVGVTARLDPELGGTAPVSSLFQLANGSDGNIWFTHAAENAYIGKLTRAGAITRYPTGLQAVIGIAAGADGRLWFAGNGCRAGHVLGTLGAISTTGKITLYPLAGQNLSLNQSGISGRGMATASPDGTVWFDIDGLLAHVSPQAPPPETFRPTSSVKISRPFRAQRRSWVRLHSYLSTCHGQTLLRWKPRHGRTTTRKLGFPTSHPEFVAAAPRQPGKYRLTVLFEGKVVGRRTITVH